MVIFSYETEGGTHDEAAKNIVLTKFIYSVKAFDQF